MLYLFLIACVVMFWIGWKLIGTGNELITPKTPPNIVIAMIGNLIAGTIWMATSFIILAIVLY